MGLVTVFSPLTTADAGETVFQPAGETRFVVACKVNVSGAGLVGHVDATLAAERLIASWGGEGNKTQKNPPHTPLPKFAPAFGAVPYSVLPDKINPASGLA